MHLQRLALLLKGSSEPILFELHCLCFSCEGILHMDKEVDFSDDELP